MITSVTIKTEHGEYTAPTVRAARTLARAGDEKAKELAAQVVKATETAWDRSRSSGFRILRVKVRDGTCKRWDWHRSGTPFYAAAVRPEPSENYVSCQTAWGVAVVAHHACDVTGCVSTANGHILALTVKGRDDGKESVVAVACCEYPGGVSTSVDEVPGVAAEDFAEYQE